MEQNCLLTVVIPAFNESNNMKAGALDLVANYFASQPYAYEILVVDDGSTDETPSLLDAFVKDHEHFRVVHNQHQGKALTVKTGVAQACGEYILFTDFDQATPVEEIEKLWPFVREQEYAVAIGSREIMGAKRENEPWYRHLMGKGFNVIVQILAVHNIHDTQCGFKLFKTTVAKELFGKLLVYSDQHKIVKGPRVTGFDVELLFLAQKYHYKIAEVPIYWHHVKTDRVSPFSESIKMFFEVLRIRLKDMRGAYAKSNS